MKKVLICLAAFVFIFYGCDNKIQDNKYNQEEKQNSRTSIESLGKDASQYFKDDISSEKYVGRLIFDDIIEKEVTVNTKLIKSIDRGRIYTIYLDPIESVPEERLNIGHFYEQGGVLYKINLTEENIELLKSTGNLPEDSRIVCQEYEMKDELDEEKGFHQYININDDEINYHSYNNNTESGYYESFTWKKNIGLLSYRSGFGAERDSIELRLLE